MSPRATKLMPMIRPLAVLTALVVGATPCLPATPAARGPRGPGLGAFDTMMTRFMENHEIPGGALAVAKHGHLVLLRGYGLADVSIRKAVDARTTEFSLASVSKTMTSLALLRLVDQGRLALDDKVVDRLPADALPRRRRIDPRFLNVTLRVLLEHESGLQRVSYDRKQEDHLTSDQLVKRNLARPLEYAPESRAEYSNLGYVVLGVVLANAGHESYEDAVRDLVFDPVGITDQLTLSNANYAPTEARRYRPNGRVENQHHKPASVIAAGGWVTSALDLVRLLTAVDGTRGSPLLSSAMQQAMVAQPARGARSSGTWFGLGWDVVETTPAGVCYAKDGELGGGGANTYFGHQAPDVDWVILFNGGKDPKKIDGEAFRAVKRTIAGIQSWPAVNYF